MSKPKGAKPQVTRLEDGTLCIGDGCMTVRIRPNSREVDIDASECDLEAKEHLSKALLEGRRTQYRFASLEDTEKKQ
jgi:hypothetical protein